MKTEINIQDHAHFSFDLWLTLIKSHPEFKTKRAALFAEFFNINQPAVKVNETVKYYDDMCNTINEVIGNNIDTFEIYMLILGSLQVDIRGIKQQQLHDFYQESERLFMEYRPVIIFDNLHALFEEIRNQDKTISILSNTGFIKGRTMRKFLIEENLDAYIDFHVYSDEINCSKPNPLAFREVKNNIKNKNIDISQVLHIGDNPVADYKGARDFGFSAHLLKI
ncbi:MULTISPECIES: HAD family hydrolase [Chryseobacterium]|uniref:Hydrolase of the HAD superfamily n=1 Tax=Chryseobacterium camelliae TaxID=1265445 RepID=A0ABU0TD43_9FLAO|nr:MULTISPECIES: HAD family hydrolase [Chryseobacterium]MDQ1094999.1 putative hydrolase of the HAD superfamily [Chryseobacterium camelliae]MDQ1098939.1 putative hydrolase of the HAD superfamily [Chryseobacterium sp. SORGH_AS_1048]MDR6086287.1 putative hydrolase of the HAD superfamily [Chryseobacterium sp. SORGH_AS_0909]MDT3407210.1 putative hydrolase of the HAD superfamily [Pseudacidovorax intermedius]